MSKRILGLDLSLTATGWALVWDGSPKWGVIKSRNRSVKRLSEIRNAVLLNKQPAWMEVYNDLYDRVVNFFEVLRDPEKSARLASLLELTPYAQAAYARSFEIAEDPVEDALRFAVNSIMSYGGGIHKPGFKRNGLLRTTPYPQTWREYPEVVRECAAELRNRNIEINNMDAL